MAYVLLITSTSGSLPGSSLGVAPEPYTLLHDGGFTGRAAPLSPDPLAAYQWTSALADTQSLQMYTLTAVNVTVLRGSCSADCSGLTSLGGQGVPATVTVTPTSPLSLRLDFGVELPAWFEFDSLDLAAASSSKAKVAFTMGIGETDQPWQDTARPEAAGDLKWKICSLPATTEALGNLCSVYPGTNATTPATYRLKTNADLYEGVRFAFLYVSSSAPVSFTIDAARAVVQTKPVNYTGHFSAPNDDLLTQVWWTAAWTVRAAFQKDFFGSVLIDRGDRESWTGDAHPIQAAALVAFHNLDSIKQNLASSIHGAGGGFPTYQLYWVLSVLDYYSYVGDGAVLANYSKNVAGYVRPLIADVLSANWSPRNQQPHLGFVGWDDRTGGGFANSSCVECERDFSMILLRVVNESARAYGDPGVGHNASLALELKTAATALAAKLRLPSADGRPWHEDLLIASAGDAVNAGLATAAEMDLIFHSRFADPITVCQLSPFNNYWTLQALGHMGKHDEALWLLRNCWGGMIKIGATTYWETFPQAPEVISGDYHLALPNTTTPTRVPWSWSGTTSLCHPWGAGPAHWMSLNLLGVQPLAAGFARWEIRPLLAASLRQVNGVVPTVRGDFEVSFDLDAREANVTVPEGVETAGRVGIPLIGGARMVELTVNGLRAADGTHNDDGDVHWIKDLGVGTHALRWRLSSELSPPPPPPSPFPPPTYAMKFTRRDDATKGNWQGIYGSKGYNFFHFCASSGASPSTTCAVTKEAQTTTLHCGGPKANAIKAVTFADFGTPSGDCSGSAPFAHDAKCTTVGFAATVAAQCVGAQSCSVECSDYQNLDQQGCTFRADGKAAVNVTLPIACSVAKTVKLAVTCVTPTPKCVESKLPPFIREVTNAYGRGDLQAFIGGAAVANDPRALEFPNGASKQRSVGKLAEEVVLAVDIFATSPNATYTLAAYFVDWEIQGRVQQVSILNATDATFPIAAPSQLLEAFGGGAYLVWEVKGDVRLRIAHVGTYPGGADALVSGIFFD